MKWVGALLLMLFTAVAHAAEQHLYLSAGGEMVAYEIDSRSGELKVAQALAIDGIGPFTLSKNGARIYASSGSMEAPEIATIARQTDGSLELLNVASVNHWPGYLDLDGTGRFLAANHFKPGVVSVWKLDPDGVFRGKLTQEVEQGPRPHGANFSANNRWLLIPGLQTNQVFVNAFDPEAGSLHPNARAFDGPQGENEARHPRHLLFHPGNPAIAYTTNQNGEAGVCVWKWDEEEGTLKSIQNLVTSPPGIKVATSTLHLTPDHRFLYVANRNGEGKSSIAGLRVSEDGRLELISHTPCEASPRSFCIDGTGRYLYVAGQNDNRLGAYTIDGESGELDKFGQYEVGDRPAWLATFPASRIESNAILLKQGRLLGQTEFLRELEPSIWSVSESIELRDGTGRWTSRGEKAFVSPELFGPLGDHILEYTFSFEGDLERNQIVYNDEYGHAILIELRPDRLQIRKWPDQNLLHRFEEYPDLSGSTVQSGESYTVRIEFRGEEVFVFVNDENFLLGQTPRIGKPKTKLKINFQGADVSGQVSSVRLWEAQPNSTWETERKAWIQKKALRPAYDYEGQADFEIAVRTANLRRQLRDEQDHGYQKHLASIAAHMETIQGQFPFYGKKKSRRVIEATKQAEATDPVYQKLTSSASILI
ncbi:MAG: beta-propeller fold lactonase family protein [Verrucomicrobiota bacterium]